ncbi:sulfonate ABC transporter substrate-binding protein, partial [Bacillus toyonensis]
MYKKFIVLSFALAISVFLLGCEKSTASSKKEDV